MVIGSDGKLRFSDLRSSVQARYQPGLMMAETYESFVRANKGLNTLFVNREKVEKNLLPVRENPTEAMTAILRGEGWAHPELGIGHDFVKEKAKEAKKRNMKLVDVCLEDDEFTKMYDNLPESKQEVLQGKFENYMVSAKERARKNVNNARLIEVGLNRKKD